MDQLCAADVSEHVVCSMFVVVLLCKVRCNSSHLQIPGEISTEVSLPLTKSKDSISVVSTPALCVQ